MTTSQRIDELLTSLDQVVDKGLAFFTGPGNGSEARIDLWTPREVLCHMVFWHQATIEGIESVASGGEPTRLIAETDDLNARAVGRMAAKTVEQIADLLRELHNRLTEGIRSLPDPNVTVLVRSNGTELTAVQRIEGMTNHWNAHLEELDA